MRRDLRAARYILRMAASTDRKRMVIAAVALLTGYVAVPLVALGLGLLIDDALAGHVVQAEVTGVVTAALLVGELMLGHFAYFAYTELGERLEVRMTDEIMHQINGSAGIEWHEQPDLADRLGLLLEESWRTQLAFAAILRVGAMLVQFILSGVLLAIIDRWLLLLPVAAAPLLLAGRRGRDVIESARERCASQSRLSRHLASLATGHASNKEIRLCGLQDELIARHAALWQSVTGEMWRAQLKSASLQTIGHLAFVAGYGVAVYLTIRQVLRGDTSVGDLVLVAVLVWTVSSQLATAVTQLQTVHASGKHIDRYMWLRSLTQAEAAGPSPAAGSRQATDPDVMPAGRRPGTSGAAHERAPADTEPTGPWRLRRGIVLDHLSFAYPGTSRRVLTDVTVTLPAGFTVALVGENGAGKSTLVKLLCRLYEPTGGHILADGTNIADIPVAAWRARTSCLFQDFARFQMRLRDDVGVGDLARLDDDERVLLALARAQAGDLTAVGCATLNDPIGHDYSNGHELSGGQWQKVGLARALMPASPMLLALDEPASALDATAEYALFRQYAASARRAARSSGAITLMVSHRFSTVRIADLIIVLADGKVTEQGSHAELVANGGLYQELYAMKSRAYR